MIKKLKFLWVVFLILVLLMPAVMAKSLNPGKIIFIQFNYKDGAITVNDIASGKGFVPSFAESPFEEYIGLERATLKIYSDTELLYESHFYIENKVFYDTMDEETGELTGGVLELNDIDLVVTAPYFKNMGKIKIYSNYNDIVLTHVKQNFDLTRTITVPTFGEKKPKEVKEDEVEDEEIDEEDEEYDEDEEDEDYDDDEENYDEDNEQDSNVSVIRVSDGESDEDNEIQSDYTSNSSGKKKSFFLKLVEIVNSVYYYIFG